MELNEGIVLNASIPYNSKVVVFDSNLGKIECISKSNKQNISPGVHITYNIKKKFSVYYIIQNFYITNFPSYWIKNNFLFFHHVLELCNYFLPFNSEAIDVFELILSLYTQPEKVNTDISRNLFLCNFFKKLGIYPFDIHSYGSNILNLISNFLHSNLNNEGIDKSIYINLRRWLLACINVHPYSNRLKTINYLKMNKEQL